MTLVDKINRILKGKPPKKPDCGRDGNFMWCFCGKCKQGGYLKKYGYKEAFQKSYEKASEEDKKAVKKLPNFNSKVFEEISGIKL